MRASIEPHPSGFPLCESAGNDVVCSTMDHISGARHTSGEGAPDLPPGLLRVDDLCVFYAGPAETVKALEHVCFDLERGSILGVVGESGCGKSTLALALLGLTAGNGQIAGGRVLWKGHDLFRLPASRKRRLRNREIALVFQEPDAALNPFLSVETHLFEVLSTHLRLARREARQQALYWLERVGIEEPASCLKAFPHQLSQGMCQRVLLALALCCEPQLIVADEPTSALDVRLQVSILDLLEEERTKRGLSAVLISHDLELARHLADRILVLYAGQVVEQAPAAAFFQSPLHPYSRLLQASALELREGRSRPGADTAAEPAAEVKDRCRFLPRCREQGPDCLELLPPLRRCAEGREVRCLHFQEENAESKAGQPPTPGNA